MKRVIFTMILTIAFISVPNVDSANNKSSEHAGSNNAANMMVLDKVKTISLIPVSIDKIRTFETRKKAIGLNDRISAYRIPAEKKDKLFGLLLLAYGGKR